MDLGTVWFVTGIDTGIGKSVATGFLARSLLDNGIRVITQKLVQTGNCDESEDIAVHRRLMGIGMMQEDREKLTAPQIFRYPASPHLAAELEGRQVDLPRITAATHTLQESYQVVLVEGAGGLMVPLTRDVLTIEYIAERRYPVVLVTTSRLGSINHTLLSLLALREYGLTLYALVFNAADDDGNATVAAGTRRLLCHVIATQYPRARWVDVPVLTSLTRASTVSDVHPNYLNSASKVSSARQESGAIAHFWGRGNR